MDRDSSSCDPYSRSAAARRTQWIVSTLAYHYGLDRGVENEIIVLATGLDQYLQEIFHHLDCQGDGKIPAEDFHILCEILGINHNNDDMNNAEEECAGMLDSLPDEFTFRQFHAKLCGYFSTKAGCQYEDGRLLVGRDSEHIETQIRLRSPLRRRANVLRPVTGGRTSASRPASNQYSSGCRQCSCTRECYEDIVALEEAEDRIAKLEEENASLRELVEDVRAALQSSDARSLALQVGLWKSHVKNRPGCFVERRLAQNSTTQGSMKRLQDFLTESELVWNSEQVKDVLLLNKNLEQELCVSREAVLLLEECNRTLKKEHMEMRKKVEEAREVLLSALGKVKELEAKAHDVHALQRHIEQLEMELLYYREHKDWMNGMEQWKKVMWSDESRFTLFQSDGLIRVRREAAEVMHPSCLLPTIRWTRDQWASVLFTDESHLTLSRNDGRQRCWRCQGERYASASVVKCPKLFTADFHQLVQN